MCTLYYVILYFIMNALSEYALCIPAVCDPVVDKEKKDYFSNMSCGYF